MRVALYTHACSEPNAHVMTSADCITATLKMKEKAIFFQLAGGYLSN